VVEGGGRGVRQESEFITHLFIRAAATSSRARRMSAASSATCRVCGGAGECACRHGHGIGGARCGGVVAVADLNRGFPALWHQPEEEPSGAGAAPGLHEFQFFGHDEDHDSVTWLFTDPSPHLHRGPAAAEVGNGVAEAEQRRPPPVFDGGYAHAQYGELPGHGLTFDVPLSGRRGGEVASVAPVLEAGLGLGGGGGGDLATSSSATIVSACASVPKSLS
jgi:hypothetical protein